MNPIKAALNHRQVIIVLMALVTMLGIHALLEMPRREDPKITIRAGLILANYPGATAEQVQAQVTRKIEQKLFQYAEVRKAKTYSTSRPGSVVVNVTLEESVNNTEQFWAQLRHDLNELRQRDLPDGVQGPIVNSNFGDVVAVLLSVRGERYTSRELTDFLDRIEDQLRTIPEVSKIKRYGEQREQLQVSASAGRIAQYGITAQSVIQTLQARNEVVTGGSVKVEGSRVALRPTGLFNTEEELRRMLVGAGPAGQPVRLGDFAQVERRFQDPEFLVRVNSGDAVLMSIEMQEGKNIVQFGEAIQRTIGKLRSTLPQDLKIDLIADQPTMVEQRVVDFGHEFTIAIVSVILVTVLLLPFRVAAIAAVAIPVTVAVTLAVLSMIGVELHQISFAGLVVALGMVVDDAIVIADNYVEQLDHGVPRAEAAWKCASDLAVPVLAATLTIVSSFLPLAIMLPGTTGEFMRPLPITVTVALLSSYAVAMLLTPVLCLAFIKTGLRPHVADHQAEAAKSAQPAKPSRIPAWVRSFRPLDAMQSGYERAMAWALPHKWSTVALGVASFVIAVLLLNRIPQRYFPFAERDQFVIDVWLPEGARIEATDATMRKLERELARTEGIRTYAAFVGAGSPRFYYNVNPEATTANYGQFVVNTKSVEETPQLVESLRGRLSAIAPEANVYLKELQQGASFASPVEVRLSGEDLQSLRIWGDSVKRILETIPATQYVTTDWREDSYGLAVDLRDEVATRLGFTESDVARQLASGFDGTPVSTYWEGRRKIDIVARLDERETARFDDVLSTYVRSSSTGARVPVRQIADIRAEWQPSRIVSRNGVRTITIGTYTHSDALPSQVLAQVQPRVAALPLPPSIRVDYGGEIEAQNESADMMTGALLVGLLGIFLILLFQFRNVKHALMIMVSIPLAMFGMVLGLVITHNPFGFTAQLGMIALTGVVVRNAIILVDFINERRAHGEALEEAALDAGRRRLRPIFLTTMAAAVGVLPMILSGSTMWSPLASVLAVGLICSMVFTLIVVPVIYVLVERRAERKKEHAAVHAGSLGRAVATAGLAFVAAAVSPALHGGVLEAQQIVSTTPARLTLGQAIALAISNGATSRIATARVQQAHQSRLAARADYFPQLSTEANFLKSNARTSIEIPAGMLGVDGTGQPLPSTTGRIEQGGASTFYTTTTLAQPLTQLVKVRHSERLASAKEREAIGDRARIEAEVALGVEQLYLGVIAARGKLAAAEAMLAARNTQLQDASRAVQVGLSLPVNAASARALVRQAEYTRGSMADQVEDLTTQLNEILGLPLDAVVELEMPRLASSAATASSSLADLVARALSENGDVIAAEAQHEQARRGISLARADYLPDVTLIATQTYQDAVAFYPKNSNSFGVKASFTGFDFGKRRATVREREAGAVAAAENTRRVRAKVASDVERAYRKAHRAEQGLEAARAALEARLDAERIASSQSTTGMTLVTATQEAAASRIEAQAQVLEAELGVILARAELARAVGVRPEMP